MFKKLSMAIIALSATVWGDEISDLTVQIEKHREAALNAEMEAQTYLPVEWNRYAEKIRQAEQHEDDARALEKKLSELLQQRQKQS